LEHESRESLELEETVVDLKGAFVDLIDVDKIASFMMHILELLDVF